MASRSFTRLDGSAGTLASADIERRGTRIRGWRVRRARSTGNEGKAIMNATRRHRWVTAFVVVAAWLAMPMAQADVVTDWNIKANEIVAAAKLPPPPAYRVMALVQAAVYEAVNATSQRYPAGRVKLDAARGVAVEAAVAEANRAVLSPLLPAQQAAIDRAYQAALATIPAGRAKTAGLALGKKAASAILAMRADDGAAAPESYRPHTTPGVYVPTVIPATPSGRSASRG
jgi:hypothetical protein